MNNFLKSIFVGLVVILSIIFFNYVGFLAPINSLIFKTLSPVQERAYNFAIGIKNFNQHWLVKRDLLKENEDLKAKLEESSVDRSMLNGLKEENDLLKKELNFSKENKFKTIVAKIITGVSDSLSKSVVINQGQDAGLEEGMAVVAENGVMVGKIYGVYDNYSKVLLLTDNKSKVAATIQNLDRTVGLVEGQFGLSFSMTNIPQDQAIKSGDLVVTSGLEGKIPKNLLIAKIDSVNQVESEIFKTALLAPIVSLDDLSYVMVIAP